MGSFLTKRKVHSYTNFKAAGCVFMNETHILAAYQPNKKRPHISGFGGKRMNDETFLQTALRETVEELFDLEVPQKLLRTLTQTVFPTKVILRESYVCVIYTFDQLIDILQICKKFLEKTIYPAFPESLEELILKRQPRATSELGHLCLLPLVRGLQIDPLFMEDFNILIN
jgi:hypothetical protein